MTRFIATLSVVALVLSGCNIAEVRAMRSFPINHIDLSLVKDGVYLRDYTYGGF